MGKRNKGQNQHQSQQNQATDPATTQDPAVAPQVQGDDPQSGEVEDTESAAPAPRPAGGYKHCGVPLHTQPDEKGVEKGFCYGCHEWIKGDKLQPVATPGEAS